MEEYICKKCSQLYPTCCTLNDEQNIIFPLSNLEIEQIKKETKEEFFFLEKVTTEFLNNLKKIFPEDKKIFSFFKEKKSYFRLNIVNKKCIFLTSKGCSLKVKNRPFFCRIYPFWVINRKIVFFKDNNCFAQKKSNQVKELLKIFDYEPEYIFQLYGNYKNNLIG
ncbi:MAG: hypothetical protein PWR24_648 [Desulfonauticus sp.]|nr:hypothetical protein [Desulfonauticus sp.]